MTKSMSNMSKSMYVTKSKTITMTKSKSMTRSNSMTKSYTHLTFYPYHQDKKHYLRNCAYLLMWSYLYHTY